MKQERYQDIDAWRWEVGRLLQRVPEGWHVIACDDALLVISEAEFAKANYCVSDAARGEAFLEIGKITDSGSA